MALDLLKPDSDIAANWANTTEGSHFAAVDDSDADATNVDTSSEGDIDRFGFGSTVVVDADTVNTLSVRVRVECSSGSSSNTLDVDLFIGGVSQGIEAIDIVEGGGFEEQLLNIAGWNGDRTAAELNGLEVSIVPAQAGMPAAFTTTVSLVNVEVDYTLAPEGGDAMFYYNNLVNPYGVN